jgi:hypothetical protein
VARTVHLDQWFHGHRLVNRADERLASESNRPKSVAALFREI